MENYLIKCNAQTSVLFNFEKQLVIYSRTGWANETLGLKNLEIPFDSITGFVLKSPSFMSAGKFSVIVNNTRLFTKTGQDFNDNDLTAVTMQNANSEMAKIRDYSRCPKCNSTNISLLGENESAPSDKSSADELKKHKELLDMGAITQEEFDEKKKQLLNL